MEGQPQDKGRKEFFRMTETQTTDTKTEFVPKLRISMQRQHEKS